MRFRNSIRQRDTTELLLFLTLPSISRGNGERLRTRPRAPTRREVTAVAGGEDWRDYADGGPASAFELIAPPRVSGPYDWTGFSPIPEDAVWPSALWLQHLTTCPDELSGRRCDHPISIPEWWRNIVSRGNAQHPHADEALRRAAASIRRFRGHPVLAPHVCAFVREATLDGLCMAPAPVSPSWVRLTLAPVAGLARWAEATGRPLTREIVFSEETIRVWLQGNDASARTSGLYFSRLWLLGWLFSGKPQTLLPRSREVTRHRATDPLTPNEVAALWRWARGLPGQRLQHRVRAFLVLGLGCGLRSAEMTALRREDVTIRDAGIDVTALDSVTGQRRTITCLADWEAPLADLLAVVPATRPVAAPWNRKPPREKTNAAVVARAQLRSCPLPFTSRSLRNTWILRHLAIGTPVDILMAGAGLQEARTLTPYLAMLSDHDPETVRRTLRGRHMATPTEQGRDQTHE